MIRVRCPRCDLTSDDPAEAFACPGCGARLRWHRPAAFTSQLAIELEGWQQDELPVLHGVKDPPPRPSEAPPAAAAAPAPQARHLTQRAITLVTGQRERARRDDEVVTAVDDVFHDLTPVELVLLCMHLAWFAGWLVDWLDQQTEDAVGSTLLQAWGLAAADG